MSPHHCVLLCNPIFDKVLKVTQYISVRELSFLFENNCCPVCRCSENYNKHVASCFDTYFEIVSDVGGSIWLKQYTHSARLLRHSVTPGKPRSFCAQKFHDVERDVKNKILDNHMNQNGLEGVKSTLILFFLKISRDNLVILRHGFNA